MRKFQIFISPGNRKLGNIPSISLPPVITCPLKVQCATGCYALAMQKRYPSVKISWQRNLDILNHSLNGFFGQVASYFSVNRPRFFRFHVSGDFMTQEYLNGCINIARENPDTKFLAMTKFYDWDYSKTPKNFTILFSAWPNRPMPKQLPKGVSGCTWMLDANDRDENIPENSFHCQDDCSKCQVCWNIDSITSPNVIFRKH
jgi:hypothetical protein